MAIAAWKCSSLIAPWGFDLTVNPGFHLAVCDSIADNEKNMKTLVCGEPLDSVFNFNPVAASP